MIPYFAHAGEYHDMTEAVATTTPLARWYLALPLFVVGVCLVAGVTYYLSKRSIPATYNVVLGLMFGAGVMAYATVPAVSILALGLGFGMALFQVLIGLSAKPVGESE